MARPKSAEKAHLPKNLYEKDGGYYWYRDPVEKRTIGLGRDVEEAIKCANELNAKHAKVATTLRGRKVEIAKRSWAIDQQGLVELQFLRENAEPLDKVCGVYFLLRDGHVVYVGQSANCILRLSAHYREGAKIFDATYIVRTDVESLGALEALYIRKFTPEYNFAIPDSKRNTAWGIAQTMKPAKNDFVQSLDDSSINAANPHGC